LVTSKNLLQKRAKHAIIEEKKPTQIKGVQKQCK